MSNTQNVYAYEQRSAASQVERLQEAIRVYEEKLIDHPIAELAQVGAIPKEVIQEFARIQYVDSILWVPMLSLIKGRISEPRLVKAVVDNIMCEAGCHGTPHTTLCERFVHSLGAETFYGNYTEFSPLSAHSVEVMNAITSMSEAQICGWLMVAETLVPTLFQIFRPACAAIEGVDLTYLDEHIVVDCDEHAQWMAEGAEKLLERSDCFMQILSGIDIGGRITISIPDVLYARTLRKAA